MRKFTLYVVLPLLVGGLVLSQIEVINALRHGEFTAAIQRRRVKKPAPVASACAPRSFATPYYTGPLFDAHFHMPTLLDYSTMMGDHGHGDVRFGSYEDPILDKDVKLSDILCVFAKEQTRGAIGFNMAVPQAADEIARVAKSVHDRAPGKFHLFMTTPFIDAGDLEIIHTTDPKIFEGIGEIGFYFMDLKGQPPDMQRFLDIYALAEKNNFIVMSHPDRGQEGAVENILRKYPNVRFLFHGPEIEKSIHGIIRKYPNAYYSIDAVLIRLPNVPGSLMYMSRGTDDFKTKFTQNYDAMMKSAVSNWKSRIEEYPDRYMWGTDRAYTWMFDDGVSVLLEKFSRDFIGKLAPAAQEKFAYQSAENLLKKK